MNSASDIKSANGNATGIWQPTKVEIIADLIFQTQTHTQTHTHNMDTHGHTPTHTAKRRFDTTPQNRNNHLCVVRRHDVGIGIECDTNLVESFIEGVILTCKIDTFEVRRTEMCPAVRLIIIFMSHIRVCRLWLQIVNTAECVNNQSASRGRNLTMKVLIYTLLLR